MKSFTACLAAMALLLTLARPAAHAEEKTKLPAVNAKVLKFVESRVGEQVADGDCWKLADEALATARAKRPGKNGYGTYVFGRVVKSVESALPGDVVQFEKTEFLSPDGVRYEMARHTAIVAEVHGTKVELLHQNWNNIRRVSKLKLDLADLKAGQVSFYRPQPTGR
jgi:hypothetical protein